MNVDALRTFLAVIQLGNLNKAAEHLNVTQSTVTARLDTLEQTLGQKLLVRSRRGAELTKAGFAFQRHAELMVQSWTQALKAVGLPKGYSGILSFACHFDLWDGAGSAWMERIRQDHPDLALEAWPGDLSDIRRWLSSSLSDIALTPEPLSGADIISCNVGRERLVQVSTVRRTAQTWDPGYIFVDHGAEFRRRHSSLWPTDETARMTFGSSRWALEYLLEAGGSAYLPWRISRPLVQTGKLHPVEGAPEIERELYMAWRGASKATYPAIIAEVETDGVLLEDIIPA